MILAQLLILIIISNAIHLSLDGVVQMSTISSVEMESQISMESSVRLVRDVPVYKADELSYDQFCKLMENNQACKIEGLTKHWLANEWVCNSEVDIENLETLFGECEVPVADCESREYGAQRKTQMKMKEFANYWRNYQRPNIESNKQWSLIKRGNSLYLKDWHMQRDFADYVAYETPKYFQSDWLNEFWVGRGCKDDYRFVYIGPKGSWTPFHSDVFGSFSWSANICGQKLWLFLLPGEETFLLDSKGKLPYDITNLDRNEHPGFAELEQLGGALRVLQHPGEVIFVPSGWYHQVINLTDTISINHNWFNAFNIDTIVEKLQASENDVKKEIEFLKEEQDFGELVENMLRAHHGMNRADFQELLEYIAEQRLSNDDNCHLQRDLVKCLQYLNNEQLKVRIKLKLQS